MAAAAKAFSKSALAAATSGVSTTTGTAGATGMLVPATLKPLIGSAI